MDIDIKKFEFGLRWKGHKEVEKIIETLKQCETKSIPLDKPVILQLTEELKTSEIENKLQKYLEDRQIYDNYKRSFMLPDDAEIVSSYIGIFIRTILVDIKSKLSK